MLWRSWLERKSEREIEAISRLKSVSPPKRLHTLTVFMRYAYDYTAEVVHEFIQVSSTAREVRGDVFRNVASRLDEYDGSIVGEVDGKARFEVRGSQHLPDNVYVLPWSALVSL